MTWGEKTQTHNIIKQLDQVLFIDYCNITRTFEKDRACESLVSGTMSVGDILSIFHV